jgi:hypothetical protein
MRVNITKPCWTSNQACEVAGFKEPQDIRDLHHEGLKLGRRESTGWRYSDRDVAELVAIRALIALGFERRSAMTIARQHLRASLADVLINRLVHGFWSLSAVEIPETQSFGRRILYLDQVAERVITKLALPLPADPFPRTPEIAVRMVDAIFDYFQSAPGHLRWERWRDAAILHGGRVPFEQAARELGAPAWFLRAVADVQRRHEVTDLRITPPINEAVRRVAPKMFPDVGAVLVQ